MYISDLRHPTRSLEDKLHQLYNLNRNKKMDLSFRPPYLALLEAFGNPHLNLPPVIHVAGTNGKGSIVAMLRSILEAEGYKVHAYTSPHLNAFNERLYVAGQEIDNDFLSDLIDEALDLNQGRDVTFFEITTAMAFTAFSRVPADFCILEVGLGGRLDCTNLIEESLVSVMAAISYDHTAQLGETLTEIAAEKAGIMKLQTPCIIGAQTKEAIDAGVINVFENKAEQMGSEIYAHDAEWFIKEQTDQICFRFADEELILPKPSLMGPHQIQNAGAALAALHVIKDQFPVSEDAKKIGLSNASWRARLQCLETEEWELWLDGGHNQSAGEALAEQAVAWQAQDQKPLHLIVGMMGHKDPYSFIKPLLPNISTLTITDIPQEPKSFKAEELQQTLQQDIQDHEIKTAQNYEQAIAQIKTESQEPGRILIAGSIYLAGHILHSRHNES